MFFGNMDLYRISTVILITERWRDMDVLFVSHVRMLREAVITALQGVDGNRACGAFCRDTVVAAVSAFAPDVVIVDASHSEGATLVAVARAHAPKASVVVLSMQEQDEEFLAWADTGIAGYLGPDTSASDLLSTVRRAGAGEVVCPPRLTALLLNRFASRSNERAARASVHTLTAREQEIAGLLADGLSNKLIARRLQVAVPTIKNHVHNILEKWDVHSRGEAAARYRQTSPETSKPSGGMLVELRPAAVVQVRATARNAALWHGKSPQFGRRAA